MRISLYSKLFPHCLFIFTDDLSVADSSAGYDRSQILSFHMQIPLPELFKRNYGLHRVVVYLPERSSVICLFRA